MPSGPAPPKSSRKATVVDTLDTVSPRALRAQHAVALARLISDAATRDERWRHCVDAVLLLMAHSKLPVRNTGASTGTVARGFAQRIFFAATTKRDALLRREISALIKGRFGALSAAERLRLAGSEAPARA